MPHKQAVSDLSFYWRKLKCIDTEAMGNIDSLQVQGDYNSATTRSFVLLFEKCSDADHYEGFCQSEEDIN